MLCRGEPPVGNQFINVRTDKLVNYNTTRSITQCEVFYAHQMSIFIAITNISQVHLRSLYCDSIGFIDTSQHCHPNYHDVLLH